MLITILIAIFLAVAAMQPSNFRVARSTFVAAPAGDAFAQVNDLHKWQEMSPYTKLDPNAKYTFGGPPEGKGATLAWAGNSKVGEGRMTIIESRPSQLVRMKLEFLKPFQVTNTAEFAFEERGDQTKVTWSMFGKSKFMCKAMGLL